VGWIYPSVWINRRSLVLLFICLLIWSVITHAQSPGRLETGMFSSNRGSESLPDGWQSLIFSKIERLTDYSLVKEDDTVVVKAISNQSASGLMQAISIDL